MDLDRRNASRIQLGDGYTARIVAVDGSWERDCRIGDVSDTGAKLTIRGSVDDIDMRDFFLLLSPTGPAHRRCQRIWLNGEEAGVRFIKE